MIVLSPQESFLPRQTENRPAWTNPTGRLLCVLKILFQKLSTLIEKFLLFNCEGQSRHGFAFSSFVILSSTIFYLKTNYLFPENQI